MNKMLLQRHSHSYADGLSKFHVAEVNVIMFCLNGKKAGGETTVRAM